MIGVVLVTHGDLGAELVKAVRHVLPESTKIKAVSVMASENPEQIRKKVNDALNEVKSQYGTLLLTDLFGGTPSNICASFLIKGEVEMVSGVNLPMLVKLASLSNTKNLTELASFIQQYGRKNIVIASEVLERK